MSVKAPIDARLFWSGTVAAIPTDWSRDTDYDDKFLQGGAAGFGAAANGGSTTHTHTANAHTHTGISHTHDFSAAVSDANEVSVDEVLSSGVFIAYQPLALPAGHTHAIKTSNSSTITYQNVTASIATDGTAPPSIRVIVIKPDTIERHVPDDAICFTDDSAAPTGYSITDGGGTTDDLDGKFIRGADTGNDGDVTGEGSATHTHTSAAHTHTVDSHTHTPIVSGAASPSTEGSTSSPTSLIRPLNHHNVSLQNKALTDLSSDAATVNTASTEPAFVKLLGIQNTLGTAATPEGVIVGYVGTEASLASLEGWELVSSTTDKQIKITKTVGEIGDNGGSDTHTHTTVNHNHTHSPAHDHIAIVTMIGSDQRHNTPADVNAIDALTAHTHSWTVTSTTPVMNSNSFTMSTDDGRLPYRTMIFIKRVTFTTVHIKGGAILGGAIL